MNSDFVIYTLIHDKLVNKVCKKLEIQFILLAKEKLIWEYNEKLARKIITHKILLNLTIESHKELTVSMLITDIKHHEVILSKLWMNKNEILLNMRHNNNNNLYTFMTSIRLTHERNLCYVCWVNKTLWSIKSLAVYTTAICSRDNKTETLYQICLRWLHVREWVFLLF